MKHVSVIMLFIVCTCLSAEAGVTFGPDDWDEEKQIEIYEENFDRQSNSHEEFQFPASLHEYETMHLTVTSESHMATSTYRWYDTFIECAVIAMAVTLLLRIDREKTWKQIVLCPYWAYSIFLVYCGLYILARCFLPSREEWMADHQNDTFMIHYVELSTAFYVPFSEFALTQLINTAYNIGASLCGFFVVYAYEPIQRKMHEAWLWHQRTKAY